MKKNKEIKREVLVMFDNFYNNYEQLDSQYVFNGSTTLDPHRFAQLVHLRTGHKITTIDRYRREFESLRRGRAA